MRFLLAFTAVSLLAASGARACPFCAAESRTLTEEINDSAVVTLAKLSRPAEAVEALAGSDVPYGFVDPESGSARFSVERVLLGEDLMRGVDAIDAIYFGGPDFQTTYFIRGVGEPVDWAIPLPLSEAAVDYVPKLFELPAGGGDRLAFFLDYLEHEDPLLGQDAYDEFARAPYADVIAIADRMDRPQLLAWIEGGRVSPSRRRLFLTMLGVCGRPEDLPRIESLLLSDGQLLGAAADAALSATFAFGGPIGAAVAPEAVRLAERQRKLGLDAMIACYLTLCGKHGDPAEGLDLIDRRFLMTPDADYSHVYATLMALRFLVEEQRDLMPVERVLASARLLLNNEDFADQVIPDLARWGDWSMLERLADMFQTSVDENRMRYVREPIVTYLDAAAEQGGDVAERAVAALDRVEPLDPDAVKRARSLRAFGFLAQARPKPDELVAAPADEPPLADNVESPPADDAAVLADAAEPAAPKQTLAERVAEARAKKAEAAAAQAPSAGANPAPPSRLVLIGVPLLGAAVCMGVFWMIFRGGVA